MKRILISLLLTAACLAGAELTGKWAGTFNGTNEIGEQRNSPAMLVLKEAGGIVTGTAGPGEADQLEIRKGKLAGRKLTFEVAMPDGGVLRCTLVFDGKTITGRVAGESPSGNKMNGTVSLKRL